MSGKIKATNRNDVIYLLKAKKLEPVHIEVQKSLISIGSGIASGISSKNLVHFTRQLAFLINAGVPVVQSLRIVQRITKDTVLKTVVEDVINNIEKGNTFAEALSSYPAVFNNVYVSIIQAGEEGGNLDVMLNQLAEYIEETQKLKSKMLKAMMYPSFVLTMGMIIVTIIMVVVVPKFTGVFSGSGVELPLMTQILVSMSEIFRKYIIIIVLGGVVIPFCFLTYLRSPAGRRLKDQLLMMLPVIGPLTLKNSLARFSRTFSCLLAGGVSVADALDTAGLTSNNFFVEKAIQTTRHQVIKGKPIAQSLRKEKIIPSLISDMVAIGEETGSTDATLVKVAEFYEEQVKTTTNAISDLIQPFLIALLGGLVGFIVISLYLPIFKMPGIAGGL